MKYPKALLSARGSRSEAYAVSMERSVWVLHGAKAPDRRGEGGAPEKAGPIFKCGRKLKDRVDYKEMKTQ